MPTSKPNTRRAPAEPTPAAPRSAESTPRRPAASFADDPNRSPQSGSSFLKLKASRRGRGGLEVRAYAATPLFTGKTAALFRATDVAEFIDAARGFAAGRVDVAALQGGSFSEKGGLMQVLVGLHIYHPGNNPGLAAVRVVLASSRSDDLLTATLQSAPLLVAQFADQLAAIADGARDSALMIGQ